MALVVFTADHSKESRRRVQTDRVSHPSRLHTLHQPCHPLWLLKTITQHCY